MKAFECSLALHKDLTGPTPLETRNINIEQSQRMIFSIVVMEARH
jgi:hypothetical protein